MDEPIHNMKPRDVKCPKCGLLEHTDRLDPRCPKCGPDVRMYTQVKSILEGWTDDDDKHTR